MFICRIVVCTTLIIYNRHLQMPREGTEELLPRLICGPEWLDQL